MSDALTILLALAAVPLRIALILVMNPERQTKTGHRHARNRDN